MSNKMIENPKLFRENVKEQLNKLLNNTTKSSNLEVGIFNYCLKEAGHKKIVKKLQENGFEVLPWTINDISALKQNIEHGVDGIITDYPIQMRDYLQGLL